MNPTDIYRRAIKRTFGNLYGLSLPDEVDVSWTDGGDIITVQCAGKTFSHQILNDENDRSPVFVSAHEDPVTVTLTEDEVRQLERAIGKHPQKQVARLTAQATIQVVAYGIRTASECAVIMVALATLAQPTQARTQLNCVTTEVIITDKAGREGSVRVEEHRSFWIDDAAKTLEFSDGRPLRVTRFDKSWISANSGDTQYEFNRGEGLLTYAGSTIEGNVTTTIVGSGRCDEASTPKT
jgi:hypothetical protein